MRKLNTDEFKWNFSEKRILIQGWKDQEKAWNDLIDKPSLKKWFKYLNSMKIEPDRGPLEVILDGVKNVIKDSIANS